MASLGMNWQPCIARGMSLNYTHEAKIRDGKETLLCYQNTLPWYPLLIASCNPLGAT